jgi:enoyl-CoA hydratase/carnithine racemase
MDYQAIQVQKTPEKIGIITLNRPEKRNALSIRMRDEITSCMESWKEDDAIGAVVFTGAGSFFSAGFDLKEFSQGDLIGEIFRSSSLYHKTVWHFPKPVIAAVNGPALGGAFDLATLCDIRICHSSASFGHPEIKFGAPPLYTPLRWIIGIGMARDLCFTGRTIDAAEAYRIGLVGQVLTNSDDVLNQARSTAKTILEAPLSTLGITKRYMIGSSGKDFDASFADEHDKPFAAFEKLFAPKAGI